MDELRSDERSRLADLILRGEPLPLDFKNVLFPPERNEYELVYSEKEREEDILADTMGVPLQPVREFAKATNGEWRNSLIFGDNLQAMKTLLQMKRDGEFVTRDGQPGIKLIYLDPPFATRREFASGGEERAYQDRVVGAQFVEFMRKRLIVMRELLAPNGSIYVHLDEKKSHYIKVIMDEVFGENRFQREIIWRIGWLSGFKTRAKNWIRNHDVILYYTNDQRSFNKSYIPYPDGYVRRDGAAPTGEGYPYEDTWNCYDIDKLDSIQIMSFAGEKTGFPTQKNENLLERIIRASSDEGDIVLDPFAGAGTTLAVAEKLRRKWIGIDSSKVAIYTSQRRMLTLRQEIGNTGRALKAKPFTLYNAGLYDFSRLRDLPWKEWRFFALRLFECEDHPHSIYGLPLDGYRSGSDVLVFNHMQNGGVVLDHGFVDDLHSQIGRRVGTSVFIIAPAASVVFLEDYIDKGDTRYYILRIPYSIINELHNRPFEALLQPVDESQVNSTVEAVGFDFIKQPFVECTYELAEHEGSEVAEVRIITFRSEALAKGASLKGNREALAMVLVDLDYPFDKAQGTDSPPPFELDLTFYAAAIEKDGWAMRLPFAQLGDHLMLIYIDVYGNEYTEVKQKADFTPDEPSQRKPRAVVRKQVGKATAAKVSDAGKRSRTAAVPVATRSRATTSSKVQPAGRRKASGA